MYSGHADLTPFSHRSPMFHMKPGVRQGVAGPITAVEVRRDARLPHPLDSLSRSPILAVKRLGRQLAVAYEPASRTMRWVAERRRQTTFVSRETSTQLLRRSHRLPSRIPRRLSARTTFGRAAEVAPASVCDVSRDSPRAPTDEHRGDHPRSSCAADPILIRNPFHVKPPYPSWCRRRSSGHAPARSPRTLGRRPTAQQTRRPC